MNPCICMPLQKGVKVLAIIDAVLSTLNLGMYVLAIVGLHVYDDELDYTEGEKNVATGVAAVAIIISILQIMLALRLLYAAKNRDYRNCRIWIIVTVIVVIINVASLILNSTSGEYAPAAFGITVFLICYKIFETVVVISFLRTLGTDGQTGNGVVYATAAVPQPQPQPYYPAQHHVYATTAFPQSHNQYPYPNNQHNMYPMQQMGPPQPQQNPVITQQNGTTHVVW